MENTPTGTDDALILAGDLGGTNFRLEARVGATTVLSRTFTNVRDFGSIEAMIRAVSDELPREPEATCLAVAGRVDSSGLTAEVTNLGWDIDARDLRRLGVGRNVALLNDFEAVALGLSSLSPGELVPVRDGGGPGDIVVLGPGTGLGVAFRLRTDSGHVIKPTESGHQEWPVRSEREWAIRQFVSRSKALDRKDAFPSEDSWTRVSFEEVVSGRGLINVYFAICNIDRSERAVSVEDALTRSPADAPNAIAAAARSGDPVCRETLSIFFDGLAVLAGDLALQGVPGGVFLVGNIVRNNLDLFSGKRFLEVFDRKTPQEKMLRATPVFIVASDRELGVEGAAIRALGLL